MPTIRVVIFLFLFVPPVAVFAQQSEAEPNSQQQASDQQPDKSGKVGFSLGGGSFGDQPGGTLNLQTAGKSAGQTEAETGHPPKRVEFVAAPIPIINPTIGNGLAGAGAVAIHLDPKDKKSPPSLFGVGAMFTNNGSRALGVLSKLYLKEDRFRITGALAKGRINYDYFGVGHDQGQNGLFVPLQVDGFAFLVEPKIRFFGKWYVGPRYHLANSDVALDNDKFREQFPGLPEPPVEIPPRDVNLRSAALGVRLQRDSRESQFYPRTGSFLDTTLDFYEPAFASDRVYQHLEIVYQGYLGFREKNVLAYHGAVCSSMGDVPFYDLCMLGKSQDIRGYAIGKYQDRRMLVGQVEYRRELFWRVGAAAYLGAGEVAPSFSDFKTGNILPGGGVGFRLTLAKENHINLRVDYAWGKDSNAFYVGVAESF